MNEQTNAADEKQLKEAAKREKLKSEQWKSDLAFIMADPRGRRFIWRVFGYCGMDRTSFTGNSETFYREGERAIGLKIKNDIGEVSPESYVTMLQESIEERRKS